MAMRGRDIRNETLEQLRPLLWQGLTDRAIALLHGVDDQQIKQKAAIEKLVAYLQRNKAYIPCYAGKKRAWSSQFKQYWRKNERSYCLRTSKSGFVALASVTTLKRNNEAKKWFEKGALEFKLVANSV